ncbi:MAG: winged helix-turn-helix transcriptional regulator [Candidatus Woesearchaeota archaeon]
MTNILDRFDRRIFAELEFDYTKPHREIAKKIRRSKSFVSYRIKRLEENGIIYYLPLIDYSKQGLTYYRIFIETTLTHDEILGRLQGLNLKTVWLIEKYDRENFVFVVLAESNLALQRIWETIHERLASVTSKNISTAYCIHHLSNNFFYNRKDKDHRITGAANPVPLTDFQERILAFLTEKPMATYREMANTLRSHEITIKKEIKNLEETKVICAYQTLLNKETLGLQSYKLFMSFPFTLKRKQQLIEALKQIPDIVYITESSYQYDLECEAYVYDNDRIKRIISELKAQYPFTRLALTLTRSETKLR